MVFTDIYANKKADSIKVIGSVHLHTKGLLSSPQI
nr:MAG TPA: hypothetical protein [Caudoviricetes sp.]